MVLDIVPSQPTPGKLLLTCISHPTEGKTGSGSVRSSHQTDIGFSKKIVLPSIFLTRVFHPWWGETCRVIQQQFRMKGCDFLGGQTYSGPIHIFQAVKSPQPPRIYTAECTLTVVELW